jgi:hypothetical protein
MACGSWRTWVLGLGRACGVLLFVWEKFVWELGDVEGRGGSD